MHGQEGTNHEVIGAFPQLITVTCFPAFSTSCMALFQNLGSSEVLWLVRCDYIELDFWHLLETRNQANILFMTHTHLQ